MANETIPLEQLLAYASGELTQAQRAEIEARLADDPQGQATVKLYQAALQAVAGDDTVAPPAHAVARAKAIFAASQQVPQASWLERATQLVAKLVFDSRTQPALAGVRSASHACSLVFETDHESIDVQAEPQRDADGRITGWQVVGQIECEDAVERCPVAFVPAGDAVPRAEAALNERGMFTIDLTPGSYEIRIGLPDHTIVVPKLDLT